MVTGSDSDHPFGAGLWWAAIRFRFFSLIPVVGPGGPVLAAIFSRVKSCASTLVFLPFVHKVDTTNEDFEQVFRSTRLLESQSAFS